MKILQIVNFLPIALLLSVQITNAETTSCVIVQVCPISFCPYVSADAGDQLKLDFFGSACLQYSASQGLKGIGFVPGSQPRCKSLKTFDGKVDCTRYTE
jgi:hypothetical protein